MKKFLKEVFEEKNIGNYKKEIKEVGRSLVLVIVEAKEEGKENVISCWII